MTRVEVLLLVISLFNSFMICCTYGKLDRVIDYLKGEYYEDEDDDTFM